MSDSSASGVIAALAGGVGAARFLRGLVRVVPPSQVVAVVNTGDDEEFHGLHVSPDLDTVVYTLAGAVNPETGWGLVGDTFRCQEALARYGEPSWFRLGDLDLATHLYRTRRLREGATLSTVTGEVARAWGLDLTVLPMTDDPAPTRIELADGRTLSMQEWFVRDGAQPPPRRIDLSTAEAARPAPGVVEALAGAEVIVICPSNPFLSIAPILALPGIRELLARRRDRVVAVSPIVGGRAIKGPADRLLSAFGLPVSCVGIARVYAGLCATLVIDEVDEAHGADVEGEGMGAVVAPTVMGGAEAAAVLAKRVLEAAR